MPTTNRQPRSQFSPADRIARLTVAVRSGGGTAAGGFTRANPPDCPLGEGNPATAFVKAATDDLTTGWLRDEIASSPRPRTICANDLRPG